VDCIGHGHIFAAAIAELPQLMIAAGRFQLAGQPIDSQAFILAVPLAIADEISRLRQAGHYAAS